MADWLRALNIFTKVINEGGITAASNKLNVTKSMVSKEVKWLEAQLQCQLLERSGRNLRPTHAGNNLLDQSKILLEQWDNIRFNINTTQESLSGNIKIGTTHWFGRHILNSHILDYLHDHEEVTIDLNFFSRPLNLALDELDFCITSKTHIIDSPNLQFIPLKDYALKLITSKVYAAKHGVPTSIYDLQNFDLITVLQNNYEYQTWHFDDERIPVAGRYNVSRMDCALDAVKAGLGITFAIYNDELKNDPNLITILDDASIKPIKVCLAFLNKNYISYLLEDCIDFLTERLS
jgi:DNA-binding transcriptional LysR family regulator